MPQVPRSARYRDYVWGIQLAPTSSKALNAHPCFMAQRGLAANSRNRPVAVLRQRAFDALKQTLKPTDLRFGQAGREGSSTGALGADEPEASHWPMRPSWMKVPFYERTSEDERHVLRQHTENAVAHHAELEGHVGAVSRIQQHVTFDVEDLRRHG